MTLAQNAEDLLEQLRDACDAVTPDEETERDLFESIVIELEDANSSCDYISEQITGRFYEQTKADFHVDVILGHILNSPQEIIVVLSTSTPGENEVTKCITIQV